MSQNKGTYQQSSGQELAKFHGSSERGPKPTTASEPQTNLYEVLDPQSGAKQAARDESREPRMESVKPNLETQNFDCNLEESRNAQITSRKTSDGHAEHEDGARRECRDLEELARTDEKDQDEDSDTHDYYKPRYMLHSLRASGISIGDAHKAFEDYEGEARYKKLGLKPPTARQQEDGCSSHMSDHDEMGMAFGHEEEECTNSKGQGVGNNRGAVKCMLKSMDTTTGRASCISDSGKVMTPNFEDEDDDDDGEEDGQLTCSMTRKGWEPVPFPIIIDSGASSSILPKDWCGHVKVWQTAGSRRGEPFTVANGEEIPNLGRKAVTLMFKDQSIRDMRFEVCNVTRALGSVSQICKVGHKVISTPPPRRSAGKPHTTFGNL